ncbi:hypothetical protein DWX57_08775 [Coprococcus sp. AF19-8AC]|uniref:hypothetical protein n=1 Tax=Coprococcus sp. AF19-8AC TaxID=2293090 RepID=UPI000E70F6B6|nr:hypothetical protein [Coprococcus sp. AF19-8AC]RJV45096.1 hypothetical protein DWX57_08775 [Coprococcus sp. AF19-8AC]
MDNDSKIIRELKNVVKNLKFHIDYRGYHIMDPSTGNEIIKEIVLQNNPTMIARCGATEMRCVGEFLSTGIFSETIKKEISMLSGVFPTTDGFLKQFCEYYMDCVAQSDILALWGVGAECKVVKEKCCDKTRYTKLTALEPYYFDNPWSSALKNKKVLVIHPFDESIKKQYEKKEKLFLNSLVLPDFASLTCIRAVQSIAGQKTEFGTWFDALDYMKSQIKAIDFDVAIIGAGAYSLPLAAFVKQMGKVAIQMSGATQILFGIKGKRWENIPEVAKLFNEYWVRPAENEKPNRSEKVEGGSYW